VRALVIVTVLALSGAAAAQSSDKRAFEAKRACASGDSQRGIELLADYYAETGDTTAIFNQGRCYQQNDLPEKALSRFREYLRVARNVPENRRQDAEGYIKDLEAELQKKKTAAAAPFEDIILPTEPVVKAPALVTLPPPPALAVKAPPAPPSHGGLRVAGYVLSAVALGAAGTGAYFSARVGTLQRDVENSGNGRPIATYDETQRRLSSGRTAQTLQWVGYGAAVAAAAGAVVLFLLSRHGHAEASLARGGALRLGF
jgi:hypothetical protein